ncbi:cupin domain-containing protein [Paraburkholderia sediminicola]|uniref:cupin domain-containing protein n=1 Tax=Paraburkholderia sediminicola TaxID=458836 RepID=UPI0038BAD4AC
MEDDVIGRARVVETPELADYYRRLSKYEAGALWTVANDIEPWEPRAISVPVLWPYEVMRPLVLKSAELVSAEDAGRRVVMLLNPKRRDVTATVGWLYSGLQIVKPGEITSAHRHGAAALRFVMEGEGGFTVVDGSLIHVKPRDFIITPSGAWHDHGNHSESQNVIWQDGLDIALVNALEANYYAVHPELKQKATGAANSSQATFGTGGLIPAKLSWDKPYSPLCHFPWDRTYEALNNYASVSAGCPFDGVIMEYVNPMTGGSVMPTMGACIQLLRPGEHTKAHQHTGNSIYQVAKGQGFSVINGTKYSWKEKDIFCVPAWAMHEHANGDASDDACLFSFNDFPVIRKLGLWLEKPYLENNGHQTIETV